MCSTRASHIIFSSRCQPPIFKFTLDRGDTAHHEPQAKSSYWTTNYRSCSYNTMAINLLLPNSFKFRNPTPKFPQSHCSRTPKFTCSSITTQSQSAKEYLLSLISDQERGLKTQNKPEKRDSIIRAVDAMASLGAGSVTTGDSLSGTWKLLWTTEKEQLFIIEKAYLFGTQAGDVLQVIDVQKRTLNNVITFPPDGVFFVRSNIEIASPQRVNFRFTSAVLRGKNWELPLPPFGQGW